MATAMFTDATFERAMMVIERNGYYQFTESPTESWLAVSGIADEIELIEPLTGWDPWTHALRVVIGCDTYVYFVY